MADKSRLFQGNFDFAMSERSTASTAARRSFSKEAKRETERSTEEVPEDFVPLDLRAKGITIKTWLRKAELQDDSLLGLTFFGKQYKQLHGQPAHGKPGVPGKPDVVYLDRDVPLELLEELLCEENKQRMFMLGRETKQRTMEQLEDTEAQDMAEKAQTETVLLRLSVRVYERYGPGTLSDHVKYLLDEAPFANKVRVVLHAASLHWQPALLKVNGARLLSALVRTASAAIVSEFATRESAADRNSISVNLEGASVESLIKAVKKVSPMWDTSFASLVQDDLRDRFALYARSVSAEWVLPTSRSCPSCGRRGKPAESGVCQFCGGSWLTVRTVTAQF
ncbi:MAG: hypothetical protein MHM6MM_000975 [Cercozoa sp. M6MM]